MRRYDDSRPDLCTLLRYDCKAYLLLAELYPRERTERIERCGEFYMLLDATTSKKASILLVKVEMFCIWALKRIVQAGGGAKTRRVNVQKAEGPRQQRHCHRYEDCQRSYHNGVC